MKMKMTRILIGIMLCSLSSLSMAGMMCDPRYENYASPTLGCELGSTNNDSATQVNLDALFGETAWDEIWRSGSSENESQTTIFDLVMFDNEYGTFSIDWTDWDSLLFVQKDGNGDPNTYVSWLLDPGELNFTFETPFLNTISGNAKDISHLTWYGIEGGGGGINQVPEPAPLALMGLGLLVMRSQIKKHQNKNRRIQ